MVVLGSQRFKVLTDRLKATKEVGEFSFRDILEAHSETVGTGAAVITEADLEEDPALTGDPCGDCNVCIRVCPPGALKEPGPGQRSSHDRFVCVNYNSASKGCGLCFARCPR